MLRKAINCMCWILLTIAGTAYAKKNATTLENIKLQEIWASGKYANRGAMPLQSLNDGKHYIAFTPGKNGFLIKYNYENGLPVDTLLAKSKLLLPNGKAIQMDDFEFSPDEKTLLIHTESESIYRRSTKCNYYLYALATGQLTPLSNEGKQSFATYSPDGKKIAFMRNNNLFIKDLSSLKETQITQDGKRNEIINGGTDWVYEEEFEFTRAFHWSPDNQHLVYLKFNEKDVPEFTMPIYDKLYPTNFTFKYPKAGEKNAKVSIHLYEVSSNATLEITIPDATTEYIPRIGWSNQNNLFWYETLNRHQNNLNLFFYDINKKTSKLILNEKHDAWIDVNNDLTFINDKSEFIWGSEKSGFYHLYRYDINGTLLNPITQGSWEVTSFYGLSKNETLFYQSNEANRLDKHIYSISLNGANKVQYSQSPGNNAAVFSADFSYYTLTHNAAGIPNTIRVFQTGNTTALRTLEDNKALKETLSKTAISPVTFITTKAADGKTDLNGWIIKPLHIKKGKKYPVLMFVYGGPGSVQVDNKWGGANYMWYQYLAQNGFIVACFDNRGTGLQGEAFKKCTYKQLGNIETEDQIACAKFLATLPDVDAQNIGIMGWSYGGYMSSLCITKGAAVFKYAVAVAPVINWRFYDSIYTERYMQTPQENAEGYDANSPSTHAEKLKGKYLLVHGTADDNVHFQNAMVMTQELVNKNIPFEFMAYPDKNHGIYGGLTRLHLFTKITNFIQESVQTVKQ